MATVGKSRFFFFLRRVEEETTWVHFKDQKRFSGGVFFDSFVARCIYTGLKVDLIRCDCNVCLLWVILSVLSSRKGQTVNTNTDLNEEPLMFDAAGSFDTASIGRLSCVVMVMSALVGGLTVPHPCLWMYSEGTGLVQAWHGAVLVFFQRRGSRTGFACLALFCSNGREVHEKGAAPPQCWTEFRPQRLTMARRSCPGDEGYSRVALAVMPARVRLRGRVDAPEPTESKILFSIL